MKRLATIALLIGILALGACASSKPCPAYAKAPSALRLSMMLISAVVSLAIGWTIFNRMGRRLPEEV